MKKIIKVVSLLIIGGGLGYLFGKYGLSNFSNDLSATAAIILIASLIPLYFLVVGVHEIGHAAMGKLMGFDFRMFIIGPFLFEKEDKNWKFKWNKNLNLSGGMVVCIPTSEINLRQKFINYAAGGPIASLFLALFSFLIGYFIPDSSAENITKELLFITAFLSILIFIITALPFKAGTFYSDGGRIQRLLKNDETTEMEILFLKIMSKTYSGTRYRDLDEADLQRAYNLAEKLKDPFKVYLLGYLFHAAFDRNDLPLAERYLEQYLADISEIPEALRGVAWLDTVIFFGFTQNNLTKSIEYWSNFKSSPFIPKAQIYMAEFIIAYLKGNIMEAQNLKNQALREFPKFLDKGLAKGMQERLESIRID